MSERDFEALGVAEQAIVTQMVGHLTDTRTQLEQSLAHLDKIEEIDFAKVMLDHEQRAAFVKIVEVIAKLPKTYADAQLALMIVSSIYGGEKFARA